MMQKGEEMFRFDNTWDEILLPEWNKEYYIQLRKFLIDEYKHYKIYPDMNCIFNALKSVSPEKVKVVILGQDPYHNPGQAHGYSFSVQYGINPPPSLQNIYQELKDDIGFKIPNHGNLTKWANQGVLLLNAVLTVRAYQANSHRGKGWELFTDKIIESLNKQKQPIAFLLWGRNAIEKEKLITNKGFLILKAPHPSPLSAYRGFFGCRHFSKANQYLRENGVEEIDWQLEMNL